MDKRETLLTQLAMELEGEEWRFVSGSDGDYAVSKNGLVASLKFKKPRLMRTYPNHDGYLCVSLMIRGEKVSRRVHRLVAESFIPNPEDCDQVNHKDGAKQNNSRDNLEWCRCAENVKHAYDNGMMRGKSGISNGRAKLSDTDVAYIRKTYIPRHPQFGATQLAKELGVSRQLISQVALGQVWGDTA